MSDHAINLDRLFHLVGAVCDDGASPNDFIELDSIVRDDREARNWYRGYCRLHGTLRVELRAHRAIQAACQQIGIKPSVKGLSVLDAAKVSPDSPAPTFLSPTLHNTLGFFPEGMPLAYLIATVITGLGILIASHVYMSRPEQVSYHSVPATVVAEPLAVGRITGTVDCKWNGGSRVSLGQKIDLPSGLMEITYDMGAKVILQGPVTYEVESNGGYLSLGKLTGRLEKRLGSGGQGAEVSNPKSEILNLKFVIRTPTAIVTDLGTEFGVEVTKDGDCETHVVQGHVRVQRLDPNNRASESEAVVLSQGKAVRVSPRQAGYTFVTAAPERFKAMPARLVRTPPLRWAIFDKTLVAWVSLNNLEQQGVGILSLVNGKNDFDGIVFGGLNPKKWMAGSLDAARSEKDQSAYPAETAKPGELVQIAVVYNGPSVTIYRNGQQYAQYSMETCPFFDKDSFLLMGRQRMGQELDPSSLPTPAVAIKEARLYNVALSPKMIVALRPNEPSAIGPVGQWTFEDGTARDTTGHFPPGQLRGSARIVAGKLILDGRDSFVAIPPLPSKRAVEVVRYDFEHDIARWQGIKVRDAAAVVAPEIVSHATGDTPDGSAGALRITIARDPKNPCNSVECGAVCEFDTAVPIGTTVRVSFAAKSLSGATWLSIGRIWGGITVLPIRIGPTWQHYELDLPLTWKMQVARLTGLIFTLVGSGDAVGLPIADGECLLDQFCVVRLPSAAAESGE